MALPDKDLSAVAGVLDTYGGLRVVVTQRWRMRHHKRHDELLFVVPEFWVREPVEWDAIPYTIARVERHVAEWIRSRNDPDTLDNPCIKLYLIRCRRTDHKRAHNLLDIVET